ncbi:unnamed protein product [Lymnaea stagnalis]|uniref:Uncharacterized protein n=1 Tax=Lymnaea stagnalis TaxID=6523 RepID=A0AAV2IG02_LYMST
MEMKLMFRIAVLIVCCMNIGLGHSGIPCWVCRINNQTFSIGESVGTVIDGCNNCWCRKTGFGCTEMGCLKQPLDCEMQGMHYKDNEIVPSDDCLECRCRNGNLACTGCLD